MPSTFVPLRMTSAFISIARRAAAVSVVKYGLPVPAAKTTTRPFSRWRTARRRMNGSATARISMAVATRVTMPGVLERVLQREGVDHRREHAHVVGGRAVHAARARREAAKQVAAADDDRGLHAELLDFADLLCDLCGDGGVDPEVLLAHQGFAGELQEDAMVDGSGHRGDYINAGAAGGAQR